MPDLSSFDHAGRLQILTSFWPCSAAHAAAHAPLRYPPKQSQNPNIPSGRCLRFSDHEESAHG